MSTGVIIPDELSIVEQLQSMYPEYKRKKRQSMKLSVSKALQVIDTSLDDQMDIDNGHNSMNKSMSELYTKNNPSNDSNDDGKRNADDLTSCINTSNKHKRIKKCDQKDVSSGDREIEKVLKKQVELKERFMFVPKTKLSDLAGVDATLEEIDDLLIHFKEPGLYQDSGIEPPKGFLIYGPTGVGKSALVEGIVNDLKYGRQEDSDILKANGSCPDLTCLKAISTELVTGITGESEAKIRDIFTLAQSLEPCIIFIDDIDAISSTRDGLSRDMERRIIRQLANCLDSLDSSNQRVLVVGVTSRPDSLDVSLRRPGRFEEEVCLKVPDEVARGNILKVLTKKVKLSEHFDYTTLARNTPGYVPADLKALIRVAHNHCIKRKRALLFNSSNNEMMAPNKSSHVKNDLKSGAKNDLKSGAKSDLKSLIVLEMVDFDAARRRVQPAAKREGFATVPDVTWDDVGALSKIREELQLSILAPIKYPEDVASSGMSTSIGILLCGPPGCGKTLLAKAIANESGINFLSVKGPELLKMYVGESERAVRNVFTRAKSSKPCILFFDEFDALCKRRGGNEGEGNNVSASVVNQLLTEMDGLESRDCILLAATNRPDILDPAILRPGRFDMTIYVGFPDANEREEILTALTQNKKKPTCADDVSLKAIAHDPRTDGYTGADCKLLVNEALKVAFREKIKSADSASVKLIVTKDHFEASLNRIKSSVDKIDRDKYQEMALKYSSIS